MVALPNNGMTVDEYLAWAQRQAGAQHELSRRHCHRVTRSGALTLKLSVGNSWRWGCAAIRARRLPCHVLPDGMTVRVDQSATEP
jgi:hypothetical protein